MRDESWLTGFETSAGGSYERVERIPQNRTFVPQQALAHRKGDSPRLPDKYLIDEQLSTPFHIERTKRILLLELRQRLARACKRNAFAAKLSVKGRTLNGE
jgi:hypothetical protein